MPGFTFDNKISLGHVLTILGFIVTIVAGWQAFSQRVATVEANDIKQDLRIEALTSTVGIIRDTVTEQSVDLRYIRAFVEDERRAARATAAAAN